MTTSCDKCNRSTATFPYADGAARFCLACTPQPEPCAPFLHDWHGSRQPGRWLCWRCRTALESQEITVVQGTGGTTGLDPAY
jgi:hypothetical protein